MTSRIDNAGRRIMRVASGLRVFKTFIMCDKGERS